MSAGTTKRPTTFEFGIIYDPKKQKCCQRNQTLPQT